VKSLSQDIDISCETLAADVNGEVLCNPWRPMADIDGRRLAPIAPWGRRPPTELAAAFGLPARAEDGAQNDTRGQGGECRQVRLFLHPLMRRLRGTAGAAGGIVAGIDGFVRHMARLGDFALPGIVRDIDQMVGRPVPATNGLFGLGEIDIHDKLHRLKETFRGSTGGRAKAFLIHCPGRKFGGIAMQILYGPLIGAIWTGWTIYWFVAARDTKPNRRRESRLSRANHIIPLLIAIALLALPDRRDGWFYARILPRSPTAYWIGVGMLVAGLAFSIWARRRLGRNWSGTVTLKENHELIRTGPYRWVRHPIYTGLLVGFLGTAVSLCEWRGLVAIALATIALLLKIRLEEDWMIETFGDRYRRYRADVRALVPFVL
jgi:protein-S-isoprenylcysteine O-methyltransferase Ste14